ncbi:MAG: hypothetical protein Tsb0021_10870 [Chlamydiales bacterium]
MIVPTFHLSCYLHPNQGSESMVIPKCQENKSEPKVLCLQGFLKEVKKDSKCPLCHKKIEPIAHYENFPDNGIIVGLVKIYLLDPCPDSKIILNAKGDG